MSVDTPYPSPPFRSHATANGAVVRLGAYVTVTSTGSSTSNAYASSTSKANRLPTAHERPSTVFICALRFEPESPSSERLTASTRVT